jgi:hypothetical protein
LKVMVPSSLPKSLVMTATGTRTLPPLCTGPTRPIVIFLAVAERFARR